MQILKITTHAGQYHADELVAINLISVFLNVKPVITRVARDEDIPKGDLPIDIGKGDLDHHQTECPTYPDGTRYCAANRVVERYAAKYYRDLGLSEEMANLAIDMLQQELKPIAEQDNYGPRNHGNIFSCWVSNLNETCTFNCAYRLVEPFVVALIKKIHKKIIVRIENKELFEHPQAIIELQKPLPIDFYPPEVNFIICKSNRGGYNVTTTDEAAYPVIAQEGADGCRFLHHNKFLGNFASLEDARKCATNSLKQKR